MCPVSFYHINKQQNVYSRPQDLIWYTNVCLNFDGVHFIQMTWQVKYIVITYNIEVSSMMLAHNFGFYKIFY